MSLNRCEDAFLLYLRDHPDEQRFWQARVLDAARANAPDEQRAADLERALRDYAAERARSNPVLDETLGGGRVSLRNLAEYLLRTWPPAKPAKRRP